MRIKGPRRHPIERFGRRRTYRVNEPSSVEFFWVGAYLFIIQKYGEFHAFRNYGLYHNKRSDQPNISEALTVRIDSLFFFFFNNELQSVVVLYTSSFAFRLISYAKTYPNCC